MAEWQSSSTIVPIVQEQQQLFVRKSFGHD
jgi:hypothetical protein